VSKKPDEVISEFKTLVNMTAAQLKTWLKTDESKEVGFKQDGNDESVGHQSGLKIIRILGRKQDETDEQDHEHMAKVVGYIRRHSAQKPGGDVEHTPWRYSLMNWGHDPMKTTKSRRPPRTRSPAGRRLHPA